MAKKTKYYVVWKGRRPGIFSTWDECSAQVTGFTGAEYKAFETRAAAEQAWQGQYRDYAGQAVVTPLTPAQLRKFGQPIPASYAVDAACSGNPGVLEYRCVYTATRAELFCEGPFEDGTNNVGEFLAIVHALARFKREGVTLPIYSDSRTALAWIAARECRTTLAPTPRNAALFERIRRAEAWLRGNTYPNALLKWATEAWGEIPADFDRK